MDTFKLEILKMLYTQQQSTAHILRERMSKITTGTISVLIVIDGWIITEAKELDGQALLLSLSMLTITFIAVYGIQTRYKEFRAVAKLIVRVEMAMKIYDKGVYVENESLYPAEYQALGTEEYEHGKNICSSQSYMVVAFGLFSVFLAYYLLVLVQPPI